MHERQQLVEAPRMAGPDSSGPDGYGHSIWEYDGAEWRLKKNCAVEGAVASQPPSIPGKFKGQLRSTSCVAA